MKTRFLSALRAVLPAAIFGRHLPDRLKCAFAISILGTGLTVQPASAAAYTTINWLDLGSVGLNSSAANATFILPGYPGVVMVSFTSTSPDWVRSTYAPAQNGIISSPAGVYGWTSVDYLGAVDITGLIDYTLTFSFSGPPVPAGQLLLGSIGLGGHLADGPTTATVNQNGTFLGDWNLGAGFGPTAFTPGAGMFTLTNSLIDPVPGYFNTEFGVTRIDNFITGSLTIAVHQVGGDGIGFTVGLIDTQTCTNGCLTIYNPADLVVATCSNSVPVFYSVNVSDTCCTNCVTLVSDPPSGTNFAVGTTTVTSTATDTMGNSNTCSFTVTVIQNTNPPVITYCPTVVLVCTNNSGGCVPMPDATSQVQATNSAGGTVHISQDISPGTILCSNAVVTFTVTDDCGNSNICTAPCYLTNCTNCLQIQCPTNIVRLACTNVPVFYQPTVTDSCCSNWTVVCTPPSGSVFALGTINNVHCVATDCNSNTASCAFTVTIQCPSNSPCTIVFPANKTNGCGSGLVFDEPQVSSPCCFAGTNTPTLRVLHNFGATGVDGQMNIYGWGGLESEIEGVIEGSDGMLYGTTYYGGNIDGSGTICRIDKQGNNYQIIWNFGPSISSTNGRNPVGHLIEASDGRLYGVTVAGGLNWDAGTVFGLNKDGTQFQILHDFSFPGDLEEPLGTLVEGPDGYLYGTTEYTGVSGFGGVFKIDKSGNNYAVIHTFNDTGDGIWPLSGMTLGPDGAFYGTTYGGGLYSGGTIYRITPDPSGTGYGYQGNGYDYELVKQFNSQDNNGIFPDQELFVDADGAIYGTTHWDETVVFKISQTSPHNWNYQVLYNTYNTPYTNLIGRTFGRLISGCDGALYGACWGGGGAFGNANYYPYGLVYKINKDGSGNRLVYAFDYYSEGGKPLDGPFLGSDGALYLTTFAGGAYNYGTLVRLGCPGMTNGANPCCTNALITTNSTVTNTICPLSVTRSWMVTTSCGYTTNGSQTVTVDCCSNSCITFNSGTNKTVPCGSTWNFDAPTNIVDNCCSNFTVSFSTITNGSNCSLTVTRTWVITDACSNLATSTQIITVAPPSSYTLTLQPGLNLIANQLDNPAGDSAAVLFPNPNGQRNGDMLHLWSCVAAYMTYLFDSTSPTGFRGPRGQDAAPILAPGVGVFYDNQSGAPEIVTFTGTPRCPAPPATLCPCGEFTLVSYELDCFGTYENITGISPPKGAEVMRWNGSDFTTYLFTVGAWTPSTPVLNVGEAAFFMVPCSTNPCITMTCATNKTVQCGSAWSFDAPTNISDPCCPNYHLTFSAVTNSGPCPLVITGTWLVRDVCGSSNICTQAVTVVVTGPPITPVIVALHHDAAGMHIIIQTQPCYTYALECKNSLTDPTWDICQTVTGNGTNWEFIDPPPLPTARFYRVRLLCP
jgi:uncharacterized repeat protein (TIGR03803 family)